MTDRWDNEQTYMPGHHTCTNQHCEHSGSKVRFGELWTARTGPL